MECQRIGKQIIQLILKVIRAIAIGVTITVIAISIFNFSLAKAISFHLIKRYVPVSISSAFIRIHVFDESNVIPVEDRLKMENLFRGVFLESDIDIRLVLISGTGDYTIEDLAIAKMEEMDIGRDNHEERGVLFLYDLESKKLKVEVGYGLEAYFTDAFIAYLTNDHTKYYFTEKNYAQGIGFLARILRQNIMEATIGNQFDPRIGEMVYDSRSLSGGAGIADLMESNKENEFKMVWTVDKQILQEFSEQETPQKIYNKYIQWLANGIFIPNLGIFTTESRSELARFPMSKAYFNFILLCEYGKKSQFVIKDNLAIQYFTDTPFVRPHFYKKTENGWQMDIKSEIRNIMNLTGCGFNWAYIYQSDIYTEAFYDLLFEFTEYRNLKLCRFRDGDNRRLPTRKS